MSWSTFAQLDDARHAREDDLVHVERLGDEVVGAQLQRLELGALFGREHDDGNLLHVLVGMHAPEHLEAILGIDDLVVILKDDAQHVAIDLHIINDEDQLRSFEFC